MTATMTVRMLLTCYFGVLVVFLGVGCAICDAFARWNDRQHNRRHSTNTQGDT